MRCPVPSSLQQVPRLINKGNAKQKDNEDKEE
jgi:hypothetical protein